MCIGTPMQLVAEAGSASAWCTGGEGAEPELVDMRLVGAQPAGTWVLVFQGAARQPMTADEAAASIAARRALAAVLAGDPGSTAEIDRCFADLVGREPELPAHLREEFER